RSHSFGSRSRRQSRPVAQARATPMRESDAMRMLLRLLLLALATTSCMVQATDLQGVLQVQWGDAFDSGEGPVQVQLATAGGAIELDGAAALLAAEDLYALNGERALVTVAGAQKHGGAALPASIVPLGAKSAA